MDERALLDAVVDLGDVLADRGLRFDLAVIGGGALILVGLVSRATADLDVVALVHEHSLTSAEPLPLELREAVEDVALARGLDPRWLNNGPTAQLQLGLPEGFLERTQVRAFGGLTLRFAARIDQVHLKLHAAVDQWPGKKHVGDLRALEPTPEELLAAAGWVRAQERDPSVIDQTLRVVLATFGVEYAADA